MTKLAKTMQKFDAQAEQVEDRACFWQSISNALMIWEGIAKHGGIPRAEWDPRHNRALAPAYKARRALGSAFTVAVNARAFPI